MKGYDGVGYDEIKLYYLLFFRRFVGFFLVFCLFLDVFLVGLGIVGVVLFLCKCRFRDKLFLFGVFFS